MIDVMENVYPIVGYPTSRLTRGSLSLVLVFSEFDTTSINADFLSQGRHDHKTGWSSVIHGKATGVTTRCQDGALHGKWNDVSADEGPTHGWTFTVCNGHVISGSGYGSYTVCTQPGSVGYLVAFKVGKDTLTKRSCSVTVFSWSSTMRDGRLYYHVRARSQDFTLNKLTHKVSVPGGAGSSMGVSGAPPYPFPTSSVPNATLSGCTWEVIKWTLQSVTQYKSFDKVTGTTPKRYNAGSNVGPYLTDDKIRKLARDALLALAYAAHDAQAEKVQELQATAFDSINRFDGNMLALIPDLRNVGKSTVNSVLDVMQSGKNPRRLASAWLSNRYGDKLTYEDLKSLFHGFTRSAWRQSRHTRYLLGKSRRQSVSEDGTIKYHFSTQVAITPNDYNALMTAVRHAYEWDYYPSLGNMWDLVPLSFVVDWFVDVSSIFEDLDRLVQARYYSVVCVMQTVKATTGCDTLKGVNLSYYDRQTSKTLSLGMSSVELGLPSAINIVDGIALFLM